MPGVNVEDFFAFYKLQSVLGVFFNMFQSSHSTLSLGRFNILRNYKFCKVLHFMAFHDFNATPSLQQYLFHQK